LEIATLEKDSNVEIVIRPKPDAWPEHLEIECFDSANKPIAFSLQ
jgi:hypothetical protein